MKCIYKLKCRDKEITEFYIGSTTNFNERKRSHKKFCNNINFREYCFPLYMFINVNGGFDNWEFEVIKEYKFLTREELTINEQAYIELLKPKLNSYNALGINIIKKKNTMKKHNIKNNRKKVKLQPNNCGYEYPGWEWDEGLPWK